MMQAQLPSGLAALMPQRAPRSMPQSMPQIPPDLLALMQQTQTLKQVSQPVVPETGQPTVAAQAAEAAEQMVQPQDNSPPGMEELMPGVQQRAMEMAQAAQPATQGDIQRAMAQRNPMQGGIGGLPGDVAEQGMAEGGVVGYAGPDGSTVEVDETKLPISERFKRDMRRLYEKIETDYMKRAGATPEQIAQKLGTAAPVPQPSTAVPDYTQDLGTPMPTPAKASPAPAPAPAERKKAASKPTAAPAMSLPSPDTRESTAVNPSESAVQFALARGDIKALGERLSKPTLETPEQQAYRKAQEEQYQRGIAGIATQRQRFEDAENARREALKGQGMENLISFLTRSGGAGSLFGGLAQASRGMEPIIAAQRAAEQAANEKKIQYFDLLDQRKETVEGLKLAALKGDADRVAAETARLRAVDAEIAKLQIGLGEKQAGQLLTGEQAMGRTQAEIDARSVEAAERRKHEIELEKMRRVTAQMKPKEQEYIEQAKRLKLSELTGGKPGTATPAQELEALQYALNTVKGAGRAESVEAQDRRTAMRALTDWEKETGSRLRMMNSKNPEVYANAKKEEIERIKRVFGIDLSVSPTTGGAVDTNNPLLKK